MQELNEYLNNVRNPMYQNAIEGKELTFYVNEDEKKTKEKREYIKFTIELLPLK